MQRIFHIAYKFLNNIQPSEIASSTRFSGYFQDTGHVEVGDVCWRFVTGSLKFEKDKHEKKSHQYNYSVTSFLHHTVTNITSTTKSRRHHCRLQLRNPRNYHEMVKLQEPFLLRSLAVIFGQGVLGFKIPTLLFTATMRFFPFPFIMPFNCPLEGNFITLK